MKRFQGTIYQDRILIEKQRPHQVLNANQTAQEAFIVSQAGLPKQITVATNMAGRGTDIKLSRDVAEMGGLFVIATEPHGSGRVDRQLDHQAVISNVHDRRPKDLRIALLELFLEKLKLL